MNRLLTGSRAGTPKRVASALLASGLIYGQAGVALAQDPTQDPAAAAPTATDAPAAPPPAATDSAATGSTEASGSLSLGGSTDTGATASATSDSSAAAASTDTASAAPADADVPAPTAPKGPEVAQAPTEQAPPTQGIGIEVLPPSAYPTKPLTGLPGGSLAGTFHGLQWPYMPAFDNAPKARLGLSGSMWADAAYRKAETSLETEPPETQFRQQSRAVLRGTPVYNFDNGWFAQGQVEFVGGSERLETTTFASVDDLWVRFGKWGVFDFQVGRMQGWEVYHYGMGLDLNTFERDGARAGSQTPKPTYGVSDLWDRALGAGSYALHYYPTEWARVELQARYGQAGTTNDFGLRPVGVLDFEFLKVKFGYESRLSTAPGDDSEARSEMDGFGGSIQGVIAPWLELGAGAGHRIVDQYDTDGGYSVAGSTTTITYGGFLTGRPIDRLLVGVGYHYTTWENLNVGAAGGEPERSNSTLMFAAVQYALFNTLFIKYVYSPASAEFLPREDTGATSTPTDAKSQSHRLRFALSF